MKPTNVTNASCSSFDPDEPLGFKASYQDLRHHRHGQTKPDLVEKVFRTQKLAREWLESEKDRLNIGHPREMRDDIVGGVTIIYASSGRRGAVKHTTKQPRLAQMQKVKRGDKIRYTQ